MRASRERRRLSVRVTDRATARQARDGSIVHIPQNTNLHVFTVHTVRPDDVGAVEIIFSSEEQARSFARDRSQDFHILAASVCRYTVGLLGTRTAVTWYCGGIEQDMRATRPGRLYPADGAITADSHVNGRA